MDERFEEYLERFCSEYNVTPEEANKLKVVQDVKKYYTEEGLGRTD